MKRTKPWSSKVYLQLQHFSSWQCGQCHFFFFFGPSYIVLFRIWLAYQNCSHQFLVSGHRAFAAEEVNPNNCDSENRPSRQVRPIIRYSFLNWRYAYPCFAAVSVCGQVRLRNAQHCRGRTHPSRSPGQRDCRRLHDEPVSKGPLCPLRPGNFQKVGPQFIVHLRYWDDRSQSSWFRV